MAENLATYPSLSDLTQTVIYPVAEPFSAAGNHITVISGSLAPESALIKLSGKTMKTFEGPAQVYDGEQKAFEAINNHLRSRARSWYGRRPPLGRAMWGEENGGEKKERRRSEKNKEAARPYSSRRDWLGV